jgi:hypothetical protein
VYGALASSITAEVGGLFVPNPTTKPGCQGRRTPDLGRSVHRCSSASVVSRGGSYSLGYSRPARSAGDWSVSGRGSPAHYSAAERPSSSFFSLTKIGVCHSIKYQSTHTSCPGVPNCFHSWGIRSGPRVHFDPASLCDISPIEDVKMARRARRTRRPRVMLALVRSCVSSWLLSRSVCAQ